MPLHPTTESCLEALAWLHTQERFSNILEIGCGSGILSLTAVALWQAQVLATDISQQAVADTQQLIQQQTLASNITVLRSDGFNHPLIRQNVPYDLIICNVLAEPLVQWAPEMQSSLTKGGICLISGILSWLASPLEDVYKGLGFEILYTIQRSPWVTYVIRRE